MTKRKMRFLGKVLSNRDTSWKRHCQLFRNQCHKVIEFVLSIVYADMFADLFVVNVITIIFRVLFWVLLRLQTSIFYHPGNGT